MPIVRSGGALKAITTPAMPWSPTAGSGVALYGYTAAYAAIYAAQPNVRTCVDFIARNIAELDLHVFRRVSDTDRVRLAGHPVERWLDHPSPGKRRYRLFEDLLGDMGIYFNAYWLKVPSGADIGLVRLPPEEVEVVGGLVPSQFRWTRSGTTYDFIPAQLVFYNGYNPLNPLFGLSPLETLRRILAEEAAAGAHREQYWQQSSRVEGVIERPINAPKWTPAQKQAWREQWQERFVGAAGAGRIPVLDDGMTFRSVSYSAKESEYLAARKLSREECAAAYHIPLPLVGILEHATFCLPEDTMVTTLRGPVPIPHVAVGESIWALSKSGELQLAPVKRSGKTGYKPLLTIRTQNRRLQCTDNHPLFARPRLSHEPWKKGTRSTYGDPQWIRADQLRIGDLVTFVAELPARGGDRCPSRVVTERFAEFCGLYLGDGSLKRTRGRLTAVRISRANDASYMDHYRETIRQEFAATPKEHGSETYFVSAAAAREFVEIGLDGDAHTKRVPAWVFALDPRLRAAFVRGFLDADGTVRSTTSRERGEIVFYSCNKALLVQIRDLCVGLGVPVGNLRFSTGAGTLPNGRPTPFAMWSFHGPDAALNAQIIGSHDKRYQTFWRDAPRSLRKYFAADSETVPPHGCGYARVCQIETSTVVMPVYDLEVEGIHNFVADGLIVHNSNIKEQHRHLYQDCLGPWLRMLKEEIEGQLLIEATDTEDVYVEFNIRQKMAGSFEEQATSLHAAVGRPYMTPNEARARLNLPRITNDSTADQLAPQQGGPSAPPIQTSAGATDAETEARVQEVLAITRARQHARLQRLAVEDRAAAFAIDLDRWNHELTIDLLPILGVSAATMDRARQANAATLRAFEEAAEREPV